MIYVLIFHLICYIRYTFLGNITKYISFEMQPMLDIVPANDTFFGRARTEVLQLEYFDLKSRSQVG